MKNELGRRRRGRRGKELRRVEKDRGRGARKEDRRVGREEGECEGGGRGNGGWEAMYPGAG